VVSSPVVVDDYRHWTAERLQQDWTAATIDCRDGVGNNPETEKACSKRDEIDKVLFAKGYCFVGAGSASRWERHGREAT